MLVEWALESITNPTINYQFFMQVGSLQHTWESGARQRLSCISYQSACSTGEETRAHSSGEATWAFVTGMEQPLAESPTRKGRRIASEPSLWPPLVDLRQMLDGQPSMHFLALLKNFSWNQQILSSLRFWVCCNFLAYLLLCEKFYFFWLLAWLSEFVFSQLPWLWCEPLLLLLPLGWLLLLLLLL